MFSGKDNLFKYRQMSTVLQKIVEDCSWNEYSLFFEQMLNQFGRMFGNFDAKFVLAKVYKKGKILQAFYFYIICLTLLT